MLNYLQMKYVGANDTFLNHMKSSDDVKQKYRNYWYYHIEGLSITLAAKWVNLTTKNKNKISIVNYVTNSI